MKRTAHSIARMGTARLTGEHLQASNDPKILRKAEPSQPALGPRSTFKYVRSESTEIRKTFERVREQQLKRVF